MKKLLVFVVLMWPAAALADNTATIFPWKHSPWTWNNTVMQVAVITMQTMDWSQTRQFVNNPKNGPYVFEANPIIRKIPGYVDIYFPAMMALTATISYILPEPFRSMHQAGTLAFTAHLVGRNKSVGVKIKF